jgi:hypothetical protein
MKRHRRFSLLKKLNLKTLTNPLNDDRDAENSRLVRDFENFDMKLDL